MFAMQLILASDKSRWKFYHCAFSSVVLFLYLQLVACVRAPGHRLVIKTMGVDTQLALIDAAALEGRAIPALADFLNGDDPRAVKLLVEETLESDKFQNALA